MDNVLLSIVVPVYNCEQYIKSCVKSIESETTDSYEIILVDDCSTDSSCSICYELSRQNHNVRALQTEKNGGATLARLLGIEKSKGKYIGFIDADDYVDKMYVDELISAMDKDTDIIGFGCYLEGTNGEIKHGGVSPEEGLYDRKTIRELIFPRLISDKNGHAIPNNLWRLVYKKELAEEVMKKVDPRIIIGEDEVFVKTCFSKANSVVMIGKELYFHRYNPDSLTKSRTERSFFEAGIKYQNMTKLFMDVEYNFSEQFDREMSLTVYNIAALKFGKKDKSYFEIRQEIIEALQTPVIKNAVKSANFNFGSSNYFRWLVLRLRLIYLMKLRATKK